MRFQVPQFIETEVKLIGPFTLKQFLWIAAGGAALMLLFVIFRISIFFFVFGIPVIAATIALAFVKIDGLPLMNYAAYFLAFSLNPRRYTYKKEAEAADPNDYSKFTEPGHGEIPVQQPEPALPDYPLPNQPPQK